MLGKSTLLIALSTLSVTTLTLAGCSSPDPTPPRTPSVPTVQLTPELHHLHGLHINAQGTVLAGTHTGLFAIESTGNTERVGDSDDDLMGLTGVAGTDTIVSSGHPGKSSSAPNPLGLRTSTDGGRNWTAQSLVGEVDFHALTTDGTLLIGFDGTSGLITSTDGGTTWASGAALPAASLAITDTGVWAVTADGLQRSTDTATTFSAVPDAPALTLLAAGPDNSLWGVDVDGNAWRSRDGQTWQKNSYVGDVEALTAADYDTAYAATAQKLYTLT
ncbi:F510_1955 family glycosylhydrolase [Rhodococcus phenolicus]|uniref:F510_1955 family glycosylhydrolase n=1 Tax=Rhodococcus phenolicus TaxID=263849 RepID=UPI00082D4E7F|nr:glycosyl hydrolase [Rhodococcus phenolicus]